MKEMTRREFLTLTGAAVVALSLAGCGGSKTLLSPKDPTMLSIWHVYGEQADSPMNLSLIHILLKQITSSCLM